MANTLSKIGYARCNIKPVQAAEEGQYEKKVPTGWAPPQDINEGKAIEFDFTYNWDGNACNITAIKWKPVKYDEIEKKWLDTISGSRISFATSGPFGQQNKITITLSNNESYSPSGNGSGLNNGSDSIKISKLVVGTNSSSNPTISNVQAKFFMMNFKYSYTMRYTGYDSDGANGTWNEVTNNSPDSLYSDIEYLIEIKNIRIPKTTKYANNVVFTRAGVDEFVLQIKDYPIIGIDEVDATQWGTVSEGLPSIKVTHGNLKAYYIKTSDVAVIADKIYYIYNTNTHVYTRVENPTTANINNYYELTNYKYVKVGSNIKFKDTSGNDITTQASGTQKTGTFRVSVNNEVFEVPIMGLAGGSGAVSISGHLLPDATATYDLGGDKDASTKKKWRNLYLSGSLGDNNNYIPNAYITTAAITNLTVTNLTTSGTNISSNKPISISDTTDGIKKGATGTNGFDASFTGTYVGDTTASIYTAGGIYAARNIIAERVFNAVFNDYAECRTTIDLTPGHVVIDLDDGSLACSSKRLQPGAQVISDTYGHLMGQTENATTPIAVAGRVLVYTYQPRGNYHAGMAVCSAPDGTVDIMSRAEICKYPDCIVGIVSEIPQYDIWGTDNIKVDGRIWIKVK